MVKNFLISLLILAILECSMSQSATCPDGTFYAPTPLPDSDHGQCIRCHFACKTCTQYTSSGPSCTTYKDSIKGYEASTLRTICYQYLYPFDYGYDYRTDTCILCTQGCRYCVMDYDVCTECKTGWDFDAKNRKCIKASLGLAATILGVAALVFLLTIITCVCALKI